MKQGIHPEYKPATIVCACGNRIETKSTRDEIHVEICSVCHPFYTGKQRLVDTAGRVERFKRKYGTGRDVVESQKEGEEPGAEGAEGAEAPEAAEAAGSAEPEPEQPKKAKKAGAKKAKAKKAKAEKAGAAPGDSDED